MRLFAAVRPPEPVLAHLARATDLVAPPTGRGPVRWVAPENRHLTVAFYGTVPDGAVDELVDALAVVATGTPPFALALHGAGVFSGRTLWVGARGDLDVLARLVAAAVEVGEEVVGRRDDRLRHRPHLTVGRVSSPRTGRGRGRAGDAAEVDRVVRALAVYTGPTWTVPELLVVGSRPGEGRGGGPLYTDVAALPLEGGVGA